MYLDHLLVVLLIDFLKIILKGYMLSMDIYLLSTYDVQIFNLLYSSLICFACVHVQIHGMHAHLYVDAAF